MPEQKDYPSPMERFKELLIELVFILIFLIIGVIVFLIVYTLWQDSWCVGVRRDIFICKF